MSAFDWEGLLRQRRVAFVTSGPNVGRGRINVKCPKCDDPSEHLGISLKGEGFYCLRCEFGGKSRAVLIKALLRCDDDEARALAGYDQPATPADDDLRRVLGSLGRSDVGIPTSGELALPREFKPLMSGSPMAEPFLHYLRGRGYAGAELEWVAREYDLRYATSGPFAWRMVLPVRDRRGALLTWTGRTVRPDDELRYLTLSVRPEKAAYGRVARVSVKSTLLGIPSLWSARSARALVVCEGPLDAVRVSLYGHSLGVWGTCMFGLSASDAQVAELELLAERFPRVWLCIDSGEELRRARLLGALATVGARPLPLPVGVKDPGDLNPEQAVDLCLRAAD